MMYHFAKRLLDWHAQHGRHDLPWQHPRTAYRVWVSEIMLQQTQVGTVIGFFDRFMQRFPDLASLAHADVDEVMALWQGLGYYARARNLHQAARQIMARHAGEFPRQVEQVRALPGIGPSTAGAILAQAFGQRHAILDGNVKRVLARHAGIEGPPDRVAVSRKLWELAWRHTPETNLPAYTQAIMDLGATICRRSRPDCAHCPVAADCVARRENRCDELPTRASRRAVPVRQTRMLLIRGPEGLLMVRRPPAGIWGGLWSLPEWPDAGLPDALDRLIQSTGQAPTPFGDFTHRFTHFQLEARVFATGVEEPPPGVGDQPDWQWVQSDTEETLGMPTPIRRFLEQSRVISGPVQDKSTRTD